MAWTAVLIPHDDHPNIGGDLLQPRFVHQAGDQEGRGVDAPRQCLDGQIGHLVPHGIAIDLEGFEQGVSLLVRPQRQVNPGVGAPGSPQLRDGAEDPDCHWPQSHELPPQIRGCGGRGTSGNRRRSRRGHRCRVAQFADQAGAPTS
jgi:hypothetical protein